MGRTETVRLPPLHAGQIRLRDACNAARFVTGVFGRRIGKTHFGVRRHFKLATEIGSRYQGLWLAPTFDLTTIASTELAALFPASLFTENKTAHTITFPWGATIFFRSADNPDSLLGRGYDFAVIDEASRISEDALKRAVLPTLADRNGRALAITTPAGRRNWIFEWYQRGLDPEQTEWKSVHAPSTENPNESIRAWVREMAPVELGGGGGMPEAIFRQEILAEFLDDAASVFKNIRGCVSGDLVPWSEGRPEVIGIDVAKHQDFTVLVGVKEIDGVRRVVCFERFHRLSWPLQMERIAEAINASENPVVVLDATGVGDKVFDDLLALGFSVVPFKFTSESKSRLIQRLALDVEQGRIAYPEIPVLLGELEAFAYEITSSGAFRYNAPEGVHDDTVIALALANHGAVFHAGPMADFGR